MKIGISGALSAFLIYTITRPRWRCQHLPARLILTHNPFSQVPTTSNFPRDRCSFAHALVPGQQQPSHFFVPLKPFGSVYTAWSCTNIRQFICTIKRFRAIVYYSVERERWNPQTKISSMGFNPEDTLSLMYTTIPRGIGKGKLFECTKLMRRGTKRVQTDIKSQLSELYKIPSNTIDSSIFLILS